MTEKPSVGQVMLDLFKESVIVQSLITMIVIAVPAWRLISVGNLEGFPDFWLQVTGVIIGYWFGAKGNFQAIRTNRETLAALREVSTAIAHKL